VASNPEDAAIVRAVISLGHNLQLDVTAEGVETGAQLAWLRRHRCEQIQGHYFCPAVSAAEFDSLLEQRRTLPMPAGEEAKNTLLIVDHDRGVTAALTRLLRRDGYRVLVAHAVTEAFELLALHAVQVIMCDQRMPMMTGAEFLSKVRKLYPEPVRILFSGYTEIQALTDAVNRGAVYRFLLKPWDDAELRANISEAFREYWWTHRENVWARYENMEQNHSNDTGLSH
jgi:response regulator RpfG family c-di-GMP phosphodiesterase